MRDFAVMLGVMFLVALLFWYVFIPKTYENRNGLLVVEYRLSNKKCLVHPVDTWGQYPIVCASKEAAELYPELGFQPKGGVR
ncbi:hypothetical protein A2661_02260 [Candidatus Giovannonibacteria bacterium RIFCSPHIGHO2_01_FULL_45_24]|uniref:Uncharacterized protein n=1 Tax=Candidatus Giovannonibacteria bacterium RIFCSPLOWO2_01_FULL_46_32 TaxID=1798353 RepID=A0A1F5XI02_9BACT|nr:MAG: hypothetical protein A2661_02260 [Candidatus Giovannonibacteria bacterium RIFCSPHIGHO2_01_FULL_45_24]OGF87520.1 MAG: hypothetical protein A3B19_02985 [Candidatus Giovannonibacteria bacterium RIFCSPLOWO2_01_FULL_46_32]